MKNTLIILTFILFSLTVYAQNGLGDFKINKTKIDFVISKYPDFIEITDSTDHPLARRFHCDKYKMLNIEVSNIELIFYNDILISFRCNRDPLIERYIVSKNGRPNISQKTRLVDVDKITFYEEEVNSFKWEDENYITFSTYTRQFNQYFNVLTNSYFYIYLKGSEKITNYDGCKN